MHRTVALIGAATIPYRARSLRLPLDGVAARRGLRGKIAFAWPTARVIHDDPPRNGPRIIPDRSAVRRRLQGQLLFGAWRERAFVFFYFIRQMQSHEFNGLFVVASCRVEKCGVFTNWPRLKPLHVVKVRFDNSSRRWRAR